MNFHNICCIVGDIPVNEYFNKSEILNTTLQIKRMIERIILKKNVSHFIICMSTEIELSILTAVLRLKAKYPNIIIEAMLLSLDQLTSYSDIHQEKCCFLQSQCDRTKVLEWHATPATILLQEEYLAGSTSFILAVWDGSSIGSVSNLLSFADFIGKEYIFLNPFSHLFHIRI